MASPFFFIKKEDGSLRAIQDYRKLNEGTVKNKYLLPLINELIDKVKDAKYITKLDIRWGYYNIWIREGDEWKAAFRTNLGLFEPTVMFFGLCNAPATFQGFMNDIFQEMIHEGIIIIYLDDILIFSNDLEEHRKCTKRVFEVLCQNRFFLKPQKCKVEWKWGEEEQQVFEELKSRLSSPPVLAIPNEEGPFRVEADASDFASGGVLL
ncbi:hypothetical protein ACEPAF_255 [Sanghuangporus sanghuang]